MQAGPTMEHSDTGCRPVDDPLHIHLEESLRGAMADLGLTAVVKSADGVSFERPGWSWQFHLDRFSNELHDSLVRNGQRFSTTELLRLMGIGDWMSYQSPILGGGPEDELIIRRVASLVRRIVDSGLTLNTETHQLLLAQKRLFGSELEISSTNLAARRCGEAAWVARDYERCASAYRKVIGELTGVEKRRVEYCLKQLSKRGPR